MSSPTINNIILSGCVLCYGWVFLAADDSDYACLARYWMLMAGFSLTFGAMFSKTWRVHTVLTSSAKGARKVVKDSSLMIFTLSLLLAETAIVCLWAVLDPVHVIIEASDLKESDTDPDVMVQFHVEYCSSSYMMYLTGLVYIVQGMLLAFGVFLAWETRKVQIPALNDSQTIGQCIYNVVVMSVVGVTVSFLISRDKPTSGYVFNSSVIIFTTTLLQCLLFAPKVLAVLRQSNALEDIAPQSTNNTNMPMASDEHGRTMFDAERKMFKQKLLVKDHLINSLKQKLRSYEGNGEGQTVGQASVAGEESNVAMDSQC